GVIMEIPDVTGLMDKVGVRMQTVQSAAHKDAGSPFRPLSEGDRALLEAMVLDVYDQFVDAVATERGLERAEVLPMADGRILTGRQAVARRLIDRLGNREDALATAGRMAGLGSDPGTVRPPEDRPTMFDVLFGRTAVGLWRRFAAPMDAALAAPSLKFMIPF
ncbi:MAG TPA: S49 family peptidase, partial [Longimicrobiales bacterium]|nr:S49 family peptidase [Longimicrobiales bacterium]